MNFALSSLHQNRSVPTHQSKTINLTKKFSIIDDDPDQTLLPIKKNQPGIEKVVLAVKILD